VGVSRQHDHIRACGLRRQLRGEPDAAGADDEYRLTLSQRDHVVSMHRARQWLSQGRDLAIDICWRFEHGWRRREDILRDAAVDSDADQPTRDLALVVMTGNAVSAVAAAQQRLNANDITFCDVVNARADR